MSKHPKTQQTEGKIDEAKGRAKEAAGALTNDKSTKWEGKADQAKGKAKQAVGEAREKIRKNI